MNDFLDKVTAYVEKYHMLSAGDVVAAGVSGGADSVCLLFVLSELRKKIPFRLMVVHVNHKIRKEAGEDAAYVRKLCEKLQVPFFLYEKDVEQIAKKEGISTEEAGRNVRYEAFREVLKKNASEAVLKIAVAHHKDDRAETVLFHLFRGTGPAGLKGICPVREDADGIEVIRPLLDVRRSEIEAFLKAEQIGWCEDATNREDAYNRNRIRHNILPYAEEQIAPGAVGNICRTAELMQEMDDFVRQQVKKAWEDCVKVNDRESAAGKNMNQESAAGKSMSQECAAGKDAGWECAGGKAAGSSICIDCGKFSAYPTFLQKSLLLYALEQLTPFRKDIGATHVDYLRSLFEKKGNREISLPAGITAAREYDTVVIRKTDAGAEESAGICGCGKPGNSLIPVILPKPGEGEKEVLLPDGNTVIFSIINCEKSINIPQNRYTKWFDYDKIEKSLVLRTRQKGDFLTIDDKLSRKSIQDYMVNEKIPRSLREEMLLLCEENHVLWVPGHRISSFYKINENTKYILQVQLRGGQIHVRAY